MMKLESVLVDSCIFIGYLRQGKDPATELWQRFGTTDLVTCGVVKAEVLRGIKNLKVRRQLEEFFSIMRYIDTNLELWNQTADLAWNLDRQGRVLPFTDITIAACAQQAQAAVFTHGKHFSSISGLLVLHE